MDDPDDLAFILSPRIVVRRYQKMLGGRGGKIGAGDIDLLAAPDDHDPAGFFGEVALRMRSDGVQDLLFQRRHVVNPQPGKPPKGKMASSPKRSLQSVSCLPQTSSAGLLVVLPPASATGPPV